MCCQGMSYLPILMMLLSAGTFVVTYIIAIFEDDVTPYFPYISDTGTRPPESCIFSEFLNLAVVLCFCSVYVRYKLVEALCSTEDRKLRRRNKTGLVIGILTSIGLSLVANFQVTSVISVHLIGAFLVFGVGVVYAFIQTWLSYQMYPDFNGLYICRIQLALSFMSLAGLIVTISGGVISRLQKDPSIDRFHWKPGAIGFTAHVISSIGEWLTAIVFLFYFLTFVRDFMKLRMEVRPILHARHLDDPVYPNERTGIFSK